MNLEWMVMICLIAITFMQHKRINALEESATFFYKEMTDIYEKFNEVLRRLTND